MAKKKKDLFADIDNPDEMVFQIKKRKQGEKEKGFQTEYGKFPKIQNDNNEMVVEDSYDKEAANQAMQELEAADK